MRAAGGVLNEVTKAFMAEAAGAGGPFDTLQIISASLYVNDFNTVGRPCSDVWIATGREIAEHVADHEQKAKGAI